MQLVIDRVDYTHGYALRKSRTIQRDVRQSQCKQQAGMAVLRPFVDLIEPDVLVEPTDAPPPVQQQQENDRSSEQVTQDGEEDVRSAFVTRAAGKIPIVGKTISTLLRPLEDRFADFEGQFTDKLDYWKRQFASIQNAIMEKIPVIEIHVKRVENRVEQVEDRTTQLEDDTIQVEKLISQVSDQLSMVMERIDSRLSTLEKRVGRIENAITTLASIKFQSDEPIT